MNAYDTFRKLRKPDHGTLRKLWIEFNLRNNPDRAYHFESAEAIEFFQSYGWTIQEYSDGFDHSTGVHG